MKPTDKRSGYQSDDDNVRYKLNTHFFSNANKVPAKSNKNKKEYVKSDSKKPETVKDTRDEIRYMFPRVLANPKVDKKSKPKQKIKVNFWSTKTSVSHLRDSDLSSKRSSRRHTVGVPSKDFKPKSSAVKVRKRVSFLPSPLFNDNHVPMVTVPDDLTIQLNEEEANDLSEDLNLALINNALDSEAKRKARSSTTQTSPTGSKRRYEAIAGSRSHSNENELEFFSKYVVQKLRKMETNQRIYSENLINTVLMLGQLGKLNGKSKIYEV